MESNTRSTVPVQVKRAVPKTKPWTGADVSPRREPVAAAPLEPVAPVESYAPPVKRKRHILRTLFILLVLAGLGWLAWQGYGRLSYQGIDVKRYQAVYLDNDNVYFGKVNKLLNGDILLTDVFRVQAAEQDTTKTGNTQQPATPDIRLIKPGQELHAPDDTMLINKSKVLFVENLKEDGKVTEAIQNYHKDNDDK